MSKFDIHYRSECNSGGICATKTFAKKPKKKTKGRTVKRTGNRSGAILNKTRPYRPYLQSQVLHYNEFGFWFSACRRYRENVDAANQIIKINDFVISKLVYSVMCKKIPSYVANPLIDALSAVNREVRQSVSNPLLSGICRFQFLL